jgi:hypothetical protein
VIVLLVVIVVVVVASAVIAAAAAVVVVFVNTISMQFTHEIWLLHALDQMKASNGTV